MLSKVLEEVPQSSKTAYTAAMEDLAKYSRGGRLTASVAVSIKNGLGRIRLPILPDGGKWVPGAVGAMQAKLAETGSANPTTIHLVGPNGNVAVWTLTGGSTVDDTLTNADSVVQTPLEGEQDLAVDVTALATGASGDLTLQLDFTTTMVLNDLFTANP